MTFGLLVGCTAGKKIKVARKDVATEAKGVFTPQASVKDASTAVSVTEMAKRKHKGICTTKNLET